MRSRYQHILHRQQASGNNSELRDYIIIYYEKQGRVCAALAADTRQTRHIPAHRIGVAPV